MKSQSVRAHIQEVMRTSFPAAEARVARFYAMQEYQLGWRDERLEPADFDPGKLLRPQFTLLACQAVGGEPAHALPLAAAIQLVHDFSLIHDDIEDHSQTRRGRPTVWNLWGVAQGINAGDGMLIVSHLALQRLADGPLPVALVLDVQRRFDQAILTICEGQFLDLSYEGNLDITTEDYLAMIQRKTAALIAAAAELGAMVGGADAATSTSFADFGLNLGLAFQIQDDVLGIWGDPAVTGKPAAADLYRRKLSLPVVYGLSTAAEASELARLYQKAEISDDDVGRMLAVLDSVDARGYAEGMAETYHHRALAAIDSVCKGNQDALGELRTIATGLLGRQH